MAIYRMAGDKEDLEPIPETSFGEEGVLERQDLQRILRKKPDILEPGLFVITEEFSNWQGSGRSIDLLALDQTGRLVVIELKRGETGEHMDLQALRYAAMVSTITLQQTIRVHQNYLEKLGIEGEAEARVSEHLANTESGEIYTVKPRIILVSEGFSQELTTCAWWLNNNGLDVTCIRMRPYNNCGEVLVETSQIIPLPELGSYLVKVREQEDEQVKAQHSGMGQFMPGGKVFRDQIDLAGTEVQTELKGLYEWALGLEGQELAVLSTYKHEAKCNLLIGIPVGNNPSLIRVIMDATAIRFQPAYFKKYAPASISRMRERFDIDILGYSGAFNRRLEDIDEELLEVLTDAYREANGLLADDGDGE